MSRKIFSITALMVFSLVLSLSAVELVVRFFMLDTARTPAWSDRPRVYYFDERTVGTSAIPVEVKKPKGVFRIVVVGDSMTFGPELQVHDAFPARLEKLLNLNASATRIEVINAGVSGFSSADQVRTVRTMLAYEPDLFILQVTLNDPEFEPFRARHRRSAAPEATVWDNVRARWRTLNFIDKRIKNTRSFSFYIEYHKNLFRDPKHWNHFRTAIERIKLIAANSEVPLVATLIPMFNFPFEERYPFHEEHEKIAKLMKELTIPFVDTLRIFRDIPPERLQILPGRDSHPNEIAHRMIAEELYRKLRRWERIPAYHVIQRQRRQRHSHPIQIPPATGQEVTQ